MKRSKKKPSESDASVEEEISQVRVERPHVVILGAGASRATCPEGDRNGRSLPLMLDFVDIVGLGSILRGWKVDTKQNFEEIFSDLWEKGETQKIQEIQQRIQGYFGGLRLPEKPTIYDHLILSLRGNDIIGTFNWDPLLMEAYGRNVSVGLSLPRLAFLHGNLRVGYCAKDRVSGLAGRRCKHCNREYEIAPLLYPIKRKNYSADMFISNEWTVLKSGLANAFTITIFGYSGPKTDEEALAAMREAWGDPRSREMEQTALIIAPTQSEDDARSNWDPFIHTHHYEVQKNFYNSWIANHPRRTGEAWRNQYFQSKFISDNPIPADLDFPNLWEWYGRFKNAEQLQEGRTAG
jgi:hypothetical protein